MDDQKPALFLEHDIDQTELISRLATTDENKHAYLKMAELYRALAEQESKLKGSGLPVVDGD